MLEQLLKKLIHSASGKWRKIMAVTGLSIAMILILSAVQLQSNYNQLLYGKSNQDSIANFLVINKNITSENIHQTRLSDTEIENLREQPFIKAVGLITPSRFKISADGGSMLPFYTDLFFESVPDEFLDIHDPDWKWTNEATFIPVVIPNMFLDLYNFGFAASQNTPQLSQELIKQMPLQITIHASSAPVGYPAKVVGFSDRISSILVPEAFMIWANDKFGGSAQSGASRVVIRTDDPGNPELVQYLKNNNLRTDEEKTRFSKYRQVVNFVVNISWGTGLAMFLFALVIFSLFIELTIMSSKEEIELLITLGSAPKQLRAFLLKQFYPQNIYICFIALSIVAAGQYLLYHFLKDQHIIVSPYLSIYTFLTALIILLVLWLANVRTIKKVSG